MSIQIIDAGELFGQADEYLRRVTRSRMNMLARGVKCRRELLGAYVRADMSQDADAVEGYRRLLMRATTESRRALSKLTQVHLQSEQVPWRFFLFRGRGVEGGMPHTHGNVICLNRENLVGNQEALVTTIVHERIHVLQRLYPGFWHARYVKFGWVPVDVRVGDNWRLNPDLPQIQYQQRGDFGVFVLNGVAGGLRGGRMEWKEGTGAEWQRRWERFRQQEHPAEIWATATEVLVRGGGSLDPIVRDLM